jgi:CDP-glucose 4,6-dehydratase
MEAMVMDESWWQGRRVFVTGHTGFMGGWLCSVLTSKGAKVHGYALPPPTTPSFFQAVDVGRRIESSTIADIRNRQALTEALLAAKPEVLFHLAAQPLVLTAYDNPTETFETNVMGTVNVLEAARAVPDLRTLLMITTDKVYSNNNWHWPYRESDRLGGKEPYSASKAASELVIGAYQHSYLADRGIVAIRAGNIIGGGDWAENRVVPDAIRSFRGNAPLVLRNPHATRPWQHVLDPLAGYMALAQALSDKPKEFSGGWNFGPLATDCLPVRQVAHMLSQSWGDGASVVETGSAVAFEETYLALDSSKARNLLGWVPRWTLADATQKLTDWYKAFYGGDDMWRVTQGQIADFEGREARHGG